MATLPADVEPNDPDHTDHHDELHRLHNLWEATEPADFSLAGHTHTVSSVTDYTSDVNGKISTHAAADSHSLYPLVINTDGDVGRRVFVGSIDPTSGSAAGGPYTPATGDVWVDTSGNN